MTAPVTTTYVWRRLHSGDIIAEASLIRGMGTWHVSVYLASGSGERVHDARTFSLLSDAHRSADDLARSHFKHTCRTGECGRWLRWPEE